MVKEKKKNNDLVAENQDANKEIKAKPANKEKTNDKKKASTKKTLKKKKEVKQGASTTFKSEFKKIKWPTKKDMIKYSIATIVFVIFFAIFFYLIELLMAFIKSIA